MKVKLFVLGVSISLFLAVGAALALRFQSASPEARFVLEERQRYLKANDLVTKYKQAESELKDFQQGWIKICKAKNQILNVDQFGQLGCMAAPAAPSATPAASASAPLTTGGAAAPAPPVKKK